MWRNYEEGDAFKITLRDGDLCGHEQVVEHDCPAWSLVDGDKVLASFGVIEIDEGVGHLWAYISDDARGHGRTLVRFGKKMINVMMDFYHRIQSTVRADKDEYIRFTEALGLEREGLMRKASRNQMDLWLFSKVI